MQNKTALIDASTLLKHIVRREDDPIKTILSENLNLLWTKGQVMDNCGRIFNISPFEYALWALDKHLWTMLLEFVPEENTEDIAILLEQYNKVKNQGITYTYEKTPITEQHFDLENTIIKGLKSFMAIIKTIKLHTFYDVEDLDRAWTKHVGGAQALLPIHVVHEYCSKTLFSPTPDFTIQPEPSTQFECWSFDKQNDWLDEASKIGKEHALFKGTRDSAVSISECLWLVRKDALQPDLDAMVKLREVRLNDFAELEDILIARLSKTNSMKI